MEGYRGDTARAVADLKGWLGDGYRAVLLTEGHGSAQRIVEVLGQEDVAARLDDTLDVVPEAGIVHVSCARLARGFVSDELRLVVLTETDLMGQAGPSTKSMRRMPSRRRNQVDPLSLQAGDYVVHEQHGVGRYVEMIQRTVQGATREYLLIEYAPSKRGQPGDRLFVPTDQLDQVTRYVGGEAPSLHRLGGADWQKAKGRARKAVKEIAAELIRLYAARTSAPGFAFSPDTPWQRELEDAFPYHETPDQLGAIDEVKEDMEKPVPMDRIICGDVGYGKTEIAVRAAFKAVQDGKQVAVLVPTTLLVNQHLSTFEERYASFPVKVAALSRFQSDKEANAVKAGLLDGTVDVVIGTHRILSSEVQFKDLGLVVVDEEQRFGVEHKEQLKHLRTNVDVLTMSATPIPRTLEMAVTGIREMSTILTPPEERHPVLTFVGAYDEKQIGAAVRRELLREGQVFYIHNRVESIDRAAARMRQLVPEARVATAHGQMNEHALEQVVLDFWEKRSDVLVCTTIVESGLDISNANTLILERADVMGLSQLHQLRGRVGREPRAGVRLPAVPAREAAHRDRARPAGDDGGAQRPGCRHVDRDEGPRDPRCGQPARRRAVRPHRRGRLRPLRPAGRRGGGRVQGRGLRGAARRQGRAPDRRAPAARLPAGGAAPARGLPQAGRDRLGGGPRGGAGRAGRPLRRPADAGREPAGRGAVPDPGPPGRAVGGRAGRQQHPVRAGRAPGERRSCGCSGSTRDRS